MVFVIRISLFFCSLCIFILHTQSVVYKSIKLDFFFFLWAKYVSSLPLCRSDDVDSNIICKLVIDLIRKNRGLKL